MTALRRCTIIGLALLATGCEAGVTQGPADHARSALQSFLIACSHDEPVAAMDTLTPDARRGFLEEGDALEGCVKFLGVARPGAGLTPLQRRRLLSETEVAGVEPGQGNQYEIVTLKSPDGKRHAVEVSQRGTLWEIDSGSLAPHRSDQAAGAEHAAESLLDACSHDDTDKAAGRLSRDERDGFRSDAKGADASTACLELLGLSKPGERLTKAEREDELDRTELSGVDRAAEDRYAVDLQAPDGRERELDATLSGGQWLLAHPEDAAVKAVAEAFLQACARGDGAAAAKLLVPAARSGFGAHANSCLKLAGVHKGHAPAAKVVRGLSVSGLDKTGGDSYSVALAGSHSRKGDLQATKRGDTWQLDKAS